jgi:hypothetical protein
MQIWEVLIAYGLELHTKSSPATADIVNTVARCCISFDF